jgi:hypothetical protein
LVRHDKNSVAIQCLLNRRNLVWRGQGEPVGWRRLFRLSVCASVKVCLMVMLSTGANAWYPRQRRGYRHQWENDMSLLSV